MSHKSHKPRAAASTMPAPSRDVPSLPPSPPLLLLPDDVSAAYVYGVNPVLEVLRAGVRPVERVLIAAGASDSRVNKIYDLARERNVPVRRVAREELERTLARSNSRRSSSSSSNTGSSSSSGNGATQNINHQGVVALVAATHYVDAQDLIESLSRRITSAQQDKQTASLPLSVILDGVEDPHNLGAVIRTIECAGAHGIFIPERRAAGLTATVAKAAAGALEYVPVARVVNIAELIEDLKRRNIWVVGTSGDAPTAYTDFDWRVPVALVMGGEESGIRRLVRERCDALVSLPLKGKIESLNVSVATGVVLYEILRQRTSSFG